MQRKKIIGNFVFSYTNIILALLEIRASLQYNIAYEKICILRIIASGTSK